MEDRQHLGNGRQVQTSCGESGTLNLVDNEKSVGVGNGDRAVNSLSFFSNCLLSFIINKSHTVFYSIIQYYSITI